LRNIEVWDINELLFDIKNTYLEDDKAWVIGYSGGKDSTALMQMVYYALKRVPKSLRKKPVYVLASDTRVEIPSIRSRIKKELSLIEEAAKKDFLPIKTEIVYPKLNDTFWVNLIGRGYPTPTSHFRWCTDRLKIRPISTFIKERVSELGSVIVVLGARKSESASRSQTMNANKIINQKFRPHKSLSKAWIYTPIEELTNNEVWIYLIQSSSPWGGDNKNLRKLYKDASGECPLVIDDSTPSCGHSRFGCWCCTVVKEDLTVSSLIESGEKDLKPLLELRNYIKLLRNLPGARSDRRRNGRMAYNRSGELMKGTGPFKHITRTEILHKLLRAQKKSKISLIESDELRIIQEIWRKEEKNRQPVDVVKRIWHCVHGEDKMYNDYSQSYKNLDKEEKILKEVCEQFSISFEMMRSLRELEEEYGHLHRRVGLPDQMRDIIRNYTFQKSEE